MSDSRRESTDQILAAWLAGEIDESDERVRGAIASRQISRDEILKLRAVISELDDVGAYERELVGGGISSEGDASEVEKVLHELRRGQGRHPGDTEEPGVEPVAREPVVGSSRRQNRFLIPGFLAAAASLLLCAWQFGVFSSNDPIAGPDVLLGDTIEIVGPIGVVTEFSVFLWNEELPQGGWFEVLVYDDAKEASTPSIAGSEDLFVPTWTPSREITDRWPTAIRWEVRAYDSSGLACGFGKGRAERSPRQ